MTIMNLGKKNPNPKLEGGPMDQVMLEEYGQAISEKNFKSKTLALEFLLDEKKAWEKDDVCVILNVNRRNLDSLVTYVRKRDKFSLAKNTKGWIIANESSPHPIQALKTSRHPGAQKRVSEYEALKARVQAEIDSHK